MSNLSWAIICILCSNCIFNIPVYSITYTRYSPNRLADMNIKHQIATFINILLYTLSQDCCLFYFLLVYFFLVYLKIENILKSIGNYFT